MSQYSQLHLTNDSFIYACQSEFAARSKKDGSFNSHLRFEDFLTGTFQRPSNPTIKEVARLFTSIAHHHTQVTPQFRRREPINLDTVAYFTCAIATLFADLESACKELFGLGLPIIPENPPEYSAEAPISTALLAARSEYIGQLRTSAEAMAPFEAFPRAEFPTLTAEQQAEIWACEVWDLIADALHNAFGEYADAAMGFAYWKYQEVPAKGEIDWRVRPPVGEAYAKAFKPLQRSARGERGHDRGDRRDRGERPDRRDRGERGHDKGERGERGRERGERGERTMQAADRKPAAEHTEATHEARPHGDRQDGRPPRAGQEPRKTEGGHRGDRGERSDRGERFERGERGGRGGRDQRGSNGGGQTSEVQLNEALEEVRQAAAQLRSHPEIGEVQLKPNNSYIRRQQHSLAVEMGLDTESRGEGRDRGVVLRMAQA